MRIIEPPLLELANLRTPLNDGERKVLDYFMARLPENWEIYIQPHLNGLRPDFVLLNPNVGIAIFEVKDWSFKTLRHYADNVKVNVKDGKPHDANKDKPIEKLARYKKSLLELYCPRLGLLVAQTPKAYATISVGVIFPSAPEAFVKKLFSQFYTASELEYFDKYNLIIGQEGLEREISAVFPEALRKSSCYMKEELLEDLRGWLVTPEFAREQRPFELDENQKKFVEAENPPEYRRLKGCAGSGKTLVIAARAARLAAQGKRTLVCVYNITLINYIRDLIAVSLSNRHDMRNIEILHFHGLCQKICADTGHRNEYAALFPKRDPDTRIPPPPVPPEVFEKKIPALVQGILAGSDGERFEKYDALFVDEGQDFLPAWWDIARGVVKPGGEKFFVADPAQDIYDHTRKWTLADMTKTGFGPWNLLYSTYRLPEKICYIANFFIKNHFKEIGGALFAKNQIPARRQGELYSDCHVEWVSCGENEALDAIMEAARKMMMNAGIKTRKAVADITFLCDQIDLGQKVIAALKTRGIKTIHTFYKNPWASRSSKMAFYKGDARIKATTSHSFKGWESSMIILYVPGLTTTQEKYLFYETLTRLKYADAGSFMTIIYSGGEEKYNALADFINNYNSGKNI